MFASVTVILLITGIILSSTTKDSSGVIFELPTAELTQNSSTGAFDCDQTQSTSEGNEFCGNIKNSQIYCKINVQTDIIDNSGNVIGTEKSSFFADSPRTTFSFVDSDTGKELNTEGGFLVMPFIKCASSALSFDKDNNQIISESEDPFCDDFSFSFNCVLTPSVETPLTVKQGTFTVKVFSSSPEGKKETFNTQLNYDEITITDSKAKKMGETEIGADRILIYIPSGQYLSEQQIVVYGNIDVAWRDFPSVDYRLSLNQDDVPTYRTISVNKESSEPNPEIPCANGEQKILGQCIKIGGEQEQNNPVTQIDYFEKLIICLQTVDIDCLLEPKYSFAGLAVFGVIVIGMASSNKPRMIRPRETIYGVR